MPLIINPIYSHGGSASKLQVQIDAINDELQIISEALVGTGKMQYKGAYIAGEEDMDALIGDVLDGKTSDGTRLENITLNGNNFVSNTEITADTFRANLAT